MEGKKSKKVEGQMKAKGRRRNGNRKVKRLIVEG
jgi:hypothetical protein